MWSLRSYYAEQSEVDEEYDEDVDENEEPNYEDYDDDDDDYSRYFFTARYISPGNLCN